MPDDCSAERPVASLGNCWANSARSSVILFWPGSAENRRSNRYRFDDRSANLVTSPAPPAQRLKSESRFRLRGAVSSFLRYADEDDAFHGTGPAALGGKARRPRADSLRAVYRFFTVSVASRSRLASRCAIHRCREQEPRRIFRRSAS